jgi:hypothetical protein
VLRRQSPAISTPPTFASGRDVMAVSAPLWWARRSRSRENLATKKDLQRKMPPECFNIDAFYHPLGSNKGTASFVLRDLDIVVLTLRRGPMQCALLPPTKGTAF